MSNNYTPTSWIGNKTVGTADVMNNIEQGINGAHNRLDGVDEQFISIQSEKATKVEVDVERKRIDSFTTLTEGSTTGDAELIDGRVGADGKHYTNIGEAIRNQVKKINDTIYTSSQQNYLIDYISNKTNTLTTLISKTYFNNIKYNNIKIKSIDVECSSSSPTNTISIALIDEEFNVYSIVDKECTNLKTTNSVVSLQNLDINITKNTFICIFSKNNTVQFYYDDKSTDTIYDIIQGTTITGLGKVQVRSTPNITGRHNFILHVEETVLSSKVLTKDDYNTNNRLYGKKIVAIGDSMVQGHSIPKDKGWLSMIANRNNMTFVNYGINGTFMTNRLYDSNKGVVERYIDMDNDADYIIVFAGTNDADVQVSMGDNNSTDISTFKGALNVLCNGLITKYPTGKIMFITPYYRNEKYPNYIKAIEEICEKYGIRVFNNMKNGGIYWNNTTQTSTLTLGDTLHLNLTGMKYASYKYEEELKRL